MLSKHSLRHAQHKHSIPWLLRSRHVRRCSFRNQFQSSMPERRLSRRHFRPVRLLSGAVSSLVVPSRSEPARAQQQHLQLWQCSRSLACLNTKSGWPQEPAQPLLNSMRVWQSNGTPGRSTRSSVKCGTIIAPRRFACKKGGRPELRHGRLRWRS